MLCFDCYRDVTWIGEDRFSEIKFNTIPGYELYELPKEHLKIMDNVRAQVAGYFSKRA